MVDIRIRWQFLSKEALYFSAEAKTVSLLPFLVLIEDGLDSVLMARGRKRSALREIVSLAVADACS